MRAGIALAVFFLAAAPATVRAETQQDQSACMMDAQTICGQFIPDRERVAHCLISNSSRVSSACRMALRNFK
jgi:hypothetical protein